MILWKKGLNQSLIIHGTEIIIRPKGLCKLHMCTMIILHPFPQWIWTLGCDLLVYASWYILSVCSLMRPPSFKAFKSPCISAINPHWQCCRWQTDCFIALQGAPASQLSKTKTALTRTVLHWVAVYRHKRVILFIGESSRKVVERQSTRAKVRGLTCYLCCI